MEDIVSMEEAVNISRADRKGMSRVRDMEMGRVKGIGMSRVRGMVVDMAEGRVMVEGKGTAGRDKEDGSSDGGRQITSRKVPAALSPETRCSR